MKGQGDEVEDFGQRCLLSWQALIRPRLSSDWDVMFPAPTAPCGHGRLMLRMVVSQREAGYWRPWGAISPALDFLPPNFLLCERTTKLS